MTQSADVRAGGVDPRLDGSAGSGCSPGSGCSSSSTRSAGGWAHRRRAGAACSACVALVAFAAVYIVVFVLGPRRPPRGWSTTPPLTWSRLAYLGALVGAGRAHRRLRSARTGTGLRGLRRGRGRHAASRSGLALAARGGAGRRRRVAARLVAGLAAAGRHRRSRCASAARGGVRHARGDARNLDLVAAQEENARLAVDERAHPVRPRPARHPRPLAHRHHGQGRAGRAGSSTSTPSGPAPRSPTSSGSAATRSPTYAAPSRATATSASPASWPGRGPRCGPPRSTPTCRTDRRRTVRAARAVRLDGARGRHQRDPAQPAPGAARSRLDRRPAPRCATTARRRPRLAERPRASGWPGCASGPPTSGATRGHPGALARGFRAGGRVVP